MRAFIHFSVLLGFLLLTACSSRAQDQNNPLDLLNDEDGQDALELSDASDSQDENEEEIEPPRLRVATFNVHRFFDTRCDTGSCDGYDYEALPSAASFAAQAQSIADGILELDPDIILLQEIESQACVDALKGRLPGYQSMILGETYYAASVDVAIFAKYPTLGAHGYRDRVLIREDGSTTNFAREFLRLDFALSDEAQAEAEPDLIVFVAHFISKASDDPERRLLEAQAAAEIVNQTAADHPQALVVFGGDLNDTPGSDPINAIEEAGLVRLLAELPDAETYTYWYNGWGSNLDHLFVAPGHQERYQSGSVEVHTDGPKEGYADSDHAAVSAEFSLP